MTKLFSLLSGLLLVVAVFVFDITMPLGVATGTLYSLVVLVTLFYNRVSLVRYATWLSVALLVASTIFFPDAGVPLWIALTNRVIALSLLLAVAFLGVRLVSARQQLQATHDQLETLSRQDGLTGLANRRYFDEQLELEHRRAVRTGNPLALLKANHHPSDICHNVQRTLQTRLEEVCAELEVLQKLETKLAGTIDSAVRESCEEGSCRFVP